jgi:hypothetical protein
MKLSGDDNRNTVHNLYAIKYGLYVETAAFEGYNITLERETGAKKPISLSS